MSDGNGSDFWTSLKAAFGGWKALVAVAIASSLATTWLTGLYRAPDLAQRAMDGMNANRTEFDNRISDIERSINQLDRTVRIYLCTREDLDVSTRIRLECREFQ